MTAPLSEMMLNSNANIRIRIGGVWVPVSISAKVGGIVQLTKVRGRISGAWTQ